MARRRRLRPAARRRPPWSRLAAVALVGLLAVGALWIRAGELRVEGVILADAERLEEVLRPELGQRLLFAGRGELAAHLAEDPWIESVHISRQLPGTLRVQVVERTAALRLEDPSVLVDLQGRTLPRPAGVNVEALPALTFSGRLERDAAVEPARRALHAVREAGWPLPSPLVSIHVAADGDVVLTDARGVRLLVGDRDFGPRLVRFAATHDRLAAGPGDEVDLRFDRQVIVRPREGGNG